MSAPNAERGVAPQRIEFVRENYLGGGSFGVTPSDPAFLKYSDNVRNINVTPETVIERRGGLGSADPRSFERGPESHQITVTYDLLKWFEALSNPDTASTLGVASTDDGDTGIDVTIVSVDGETRDTITTDGTSATTFTVGTESFETLGRIEVGSTTSGDIVVSTDDGGSAGTELGRLTVGDTVQRKGEDAAYDGLVRQRDELLPESHTYLTREEKSHVGADATVSGNVGRPTRLYHYGRGGVVSEGTMMGNPSEQQPISMELTYRFQYLRAQQIDQPTAAEADTFLTVRSTDESDTDLSVDIEDEGGDTSESVTLDSSDATSIVSTTNEYGDIDAIHVDSENTGDVVVSINTDDDSSPTEGDELARVFGANTYDGVESDYGVPTIGDGRREPVSALGEPENFLGDTVEAGTDPYPYEIQGISLTWGNNVTTTEHAEAFGMAIHPGNRNLNWQSTVFGENVTVDALQAHFQNAARDHSWEMDGGTLTLEGCVLQEPGEVAKETGQAVLTVENNWTADGLSFE